MSSKMEQLELQKQQLINELDSVFAEIRKEAEASVCRFIASVWQNGTRSSGKNYLRLSDIEVRLTEDGIKMLNEAAGHSKYSILAKLGIVIMSAQNKEFYYNGETYIIRRRDGTGFPIIRVEKSGIITGEME